MWKRFGQGQEGREQCGGHASGEDQAVPRDPVGQAPHGTEHQRRHDRVGAHHHPHLDPGETQVLKHENGQEHPEIDNPEGPRKDESAQRDEGPAFFQHGQIDPECSDFAYPVLAEMPHENQGCQKCEHAEGREADEDPGEAERVLDDPARHRTDGESRVVGNVESSHGGSLMPGRGHVADVSERNGPDEGRRDALQESQEDQRRGRRQAEISDRDGSVCEQADHEKAPPADAVGPPARQGREEGLGGGKTGEDEGQMNARGAVGRGIDREKGVRDAEAEAGQEVHDEEGAVYPFFLRAAHQASLRSVFRCRVLISAAGS